MMSLCCKDMAYHLNKNCLEHKDIYDCPDVIIFRSPDRNVYGLPIHDGGSSYIKIIYCPWCGNKL